MLSLTPALIAAKNTEHDATDIWTFLFHVRVSDTVHLYLTSHDENVTFQGKVYRPAAIDLQEFQDDSEGNLNDLIVTVSATPGRAAKLIDDNDGFRAARVTVHAVSLEHLTAPISETYEVISCTTNRLGATLRLGFLNLLSIKLPRRVYTIDEFPGIQI